MLLFSHSDGLSQARFLDTNQIGTALSEIATNEGFDIKLEKISSPVSESWVIEGDNRMTAMKGFSGLGLGVTVLYWEII